MENSIMNYIIEQCLILIPSLWVIGYIVKQLIFVPNKFIPLILLFLGIAGAIGILGFDIQAIIQGVLVAGAAIGLHQVQHQLEKK